MALHGFLSLPFALALAGVAAAWYCYLINPKVPAWFRQRFDAIYTLLDNKYYLDKINEVVFAGGARAIGKGLWQGGDVKVIDGLIVNGSARVVGWFASVIRYFQSGYIYHYAFAMIVGMLGLLTFFLFLNK